VKVPVVSGPPKTTEVPEVVEEIMTLFDVVTAPERVAPPESVIVKVPIFVATAAETLITPLVPAFNVKLRAELAPAIVLPKLIPAPPALPRVVSKVT
jgi:hypothetical protein